MKHHGVEEGAIYAWRIISRGEWRMSCISRVLLWVKLN